jgi:hypothetical protein
LRADLLKKKSEIIENADKKILLQGMKVKKFKTDSDYFNSSSESEKKDENLSPCSTHSLV